MRRKKKPITDYDKLYVRTKRNFNKYVQLRDLQIVNGGTVAVCYTCGAKKAINCTYDLAKYHAGHSWKDVYYSSVEFDPRAVKGQCYQCNVKMSGNESIFQEKLRNELGIKGYEGLILKKNQTKKWTFAELEKINKESLKLVKVEKIRLGIK